MKKLMLNFETDVCFVFRVVSFSKLMLKADWWMKKKHFNMLKYPTCSAIIKTYHTNGYITLLLLLPLSLWIWEMKHLIDSELKSFLIIWVTAKVSVYDTWGYADARFEILISKAINRQDTRAQCFLLSTGPWHRPCKVSGHKFNPDATSQACSFSCNSCAHCPKAPRLISAVLGIPWHGVRAIQKEGMHGKVDWVYYAGCCSHCRRCIGIKKKIFTFPLQKTKTLRDVVFKWTRWGV